MSTSNAFPTPHGRTLILTAEQRAIVHRQASSAIIVALAGTGKTTTLACAAVHALQCQADTRILVLAHSKAGVHAFSHRLRQLLPHAPQHLHCTTLERWSARALRQRDSAIRFLTDPLELRNQAQQALALLEEQLQRHPDARIELPSEVDMAAFMAFNHAAKKSMLLQRVHDEGVDLADFCDAHMLNYTQARLFSAYERLRIDVCGDVRYYAEGDCTYALAQESAQAIDAPYDLVLFDEMHDLDWASLSVLRHILLRSNARFLGAGDFNQHIQAQAWSVFQDKVQQLADFLPQASCSFPLTQSRRFGPQIAQAVNRWFNVDMKAPSSRRSTVTYLGYDTDSQCIEQLLQIQAALPAKDISEHHPLTVILRHAHDATAVEIAAHRAGKSVSLQGIKPFYAYREIALLLGLLYAHGLQAAAWKSAPCPLHTDVLAAFIDAALYFGKGHIDSSREGSQSQAMAEQMQAHPQSIWRFLIDRSHLAGGQRNLASFGKFLSLPLALQDDAAALLKQADLWGLYANTPMSPEDKKQLETRVHSFVAAIQTMSVQQVISEVVAMTKRNQEKLQSQPHCDFQLISIEQAKGQEFAYVAIPFLEPGRFPAPAPKAIAFLERNRLYVAMTRAKQQLWLLENTQHPIEPLDAMPAPLSTPSH